MSTKLLIPLLFFFIMFRGFQVEFLTNVSANRKGPVCYGENL